MTKREELVKYYGGEEAYKAEMKRRAATSNAASRAKALKANKVKELGEEGYRAEMRRRGAIRKNVA